MAIYAGEIRIRSINVDKIKSRSVALIETVAAALRQNEMARLRIAGFDTLVSRVTSSDRL
jgi:hypothetical protein